jgi:hypothetical protein
MIKLMLLRCLLIGAYAIFIAVGIAGAIRAQAADKTIVRFTSGQRSTIPFRTAHGLLLIEARVNGSESGWFIFDTGAESTVIDAGLAKSLGLKRAGQVTGTGSAGTVTAGVLKNNSLDLKGIAVTDLLLYAIPLESFTPSLGVKIAGVLGNDIIGQTVAEIDYAAGIINLYEPRGYTAPSNGQVIPITIEDNLPFIRARVTPEGGRPINAKLEIDTGATSSLLLNSPFVRRHRLVRTLRRSMPIRSGGVGGSGKALLGRVDRLAIGTLLLDRPIVRLYQDVRGDNASSKYDGLLGAEALRRFKLTVDMQGRRLIIEPNSALGQPYEFDMSGMELVADGPELTTILIDEVHPTSAAARAGIKGGDVLQTIDGRPASEVGLERLNHLMTQDGAIYDLQLRRGLRIVNVKLKLTRRI